MKDLIERADALAAIALGDTVNQLQAKIRAIPRAHFAAAAAPDLARAYIAQAAELTRLRARVEAADKLASVVDDYIIGMAETGHVEAALSAYERSKG